jgi:adenine deaminase
MLERFIERLPKSELHIHIEGSLEPELMFEFAERNGVKLPYKSVGDVRNAYDFKDLDRFFKFIIKACGYSFMKGIFTI